MVDAKEIKIDVVHEIIHDQIRALAEALYEQSGIKLKDVSIDWSSYPSTIQEIKIYTTKR